MNRRWLMGMAMGVMLAASVPAHAIVLRYAPRVDEVHKQKATISGRMETTMEALPEPMRMEMTGDIDYSEKALSQTGEATRMRTELLGGKMTMATGDQSQSVDMPTGHMVADMDRRGRVVKVVEVDLPGAEQMMGAGADNFPNWSQFGAFPEGDVNVNDTWTGKVSLPATKGMPTIEMTFKSTLLDLTTFQARKCAKIRTSFDGPFKMELSEMPGAPAGAEGTMDATIKGEIVWYYDYEASVYAYGEGTVGMDMTMNMSAPEMPAGSMTMKMLMNIKTALQP